MRGPREVNSCLLIQLEANGQVEINFNGRTILAAGFPFRHTCYHAQGFFVAPAAHRAQDSDIGHAAIFVDHKPE